MSSSQIYLHLLLCLPMLLTSMISTPSTENQLSNVLEQIWCLENAVQIQNELAQQRCPITFLQRNGVNCSVYCDGRFVLNNSLYEEEGCVNFALDLTLSFREINISFLNTQHCNVSKCIVDWINITCNISSHSENNEHFLDKIDFTGDDILTDLVKALSCGIAGCIIGILATISGRCSRHKLRMVTKNGQISTDPQLDNQDWNDSGDNMHVYSDINDTVRDTSSRKSGTSDHFNESNGLKDSDSSLESCNKEQTTRNESEESKTYFELEKMMNGLS
ncbi:uncharacterized protein LOC125655237 [Ostrea edulis]|uniref:uncharacterized protein LOC125655237 n=1 Tax=Ostrea edulis TaxID=37623 RepID=UPI0024AF1761|nr:uncharacterized protein LOC125655237 [Ostrea edulis]